MVGKTPHKPHFVHMESHIIDLNMEMPSMEAAASHSNMAVCAVPGKPCNTHPDEH